MSDSATESPLRLDATAISNPFALLYSPATRISWLDELFKIGSSPGARAVTVRMIAAVGVPLLGNVLLGTLAATYPRMAPKPR